MSTDLTPYQPHAPVAQTDTASVALQRLGEWVHHAEAAFAVAERLVQSSFVPTTFRGKPTEAAAAILAGSEVGLSPMAALRSFDIISGQAAARAVTLRAIVQSQGHDIELVESTATRCVMQGRRRGTPTWQKVTWTIERAQQLKLTGKDNWKSQPQSMLLARATSEIARLVAADAILGIAYSAEEIIDDGAGQTPFVEASVEATAAPALPAAPATRRMSRKPAAIDPAPEPAPDETPTVEPEPVVEDRITAAQSKALHATFTEAGITQRDHRLDYCRNLLGRDIDTSNDLTRSEASAVIDALKSDTADRASTADQADELWRDN